MHGNELLKSRISKIFGGKSEGKCVVYVMSRDQRVKDNHALLCAQKHAIAKNLPFAVIFCLQEATGVRSREHYEFMLEGLKQVEKDLSKLNIPFILLVGSPLELLRSTFNHLQPDSVYFDFNPLRGPIKLQKELSQSSNYSVYIVDTHNIVPVWVTSEKREVGAYTIRPKIHKKLSEYLVEPEQITSHPINWPGEVKPMAELSDIIQAVLENINPSGIIAGFKSGEQAAHDHLDAFINTKLATYAVDRNDPSKGSQSDLSPYLHFGQISSLRVALLLQEEAHKNNTELHFLSSPKMPKPEDAENTLQHGIDSLIEEMIVRKELADNFCYYDENYDNLESAPEWARKSLDKHRADPREFVYSLKQLEEARTHDPAWNAAQRQLTKSGKMHGYMRMYWAKKVLEWSPSRVHGLGTTADFSTDSDMDGTKSTATHAKSAEEINIITQAGHSSVVKVKISSLDGAEWAIEVLKYLNDHYSIDGGDPNGYAGIMWSVAGVHDRPWIEREIFGVVRYMNYGGLKRKFDIENYERV